MRLVQEPLENYLTAKSQRYTGNVLANSFRNKYPSDIKQFLPDSDRYKIKGSVGQTVWANVPWIAIFDLLVTDTAQEGYYIVLLYKADMSGVYLSLNQGVKSIQELYKKSKRKRAAKTLRERAAEFRARIDEEVLVKYQTQIELHTKGSSQLYEDGNIISLEYNLLDLPSEEQFGEDLRDMLNVYESLAYNDSITLETEIGKTIHESKKLRWHYRVERSSGISDKVKQKKGYICEVCDFNFERYYGKLGSKFIEAHHLKPITDLEIGEVRKIDLKEDFAVLCSNCHRMAHKLEDSSDLEKLRHMIQ